MTRGKGLGPREKAWDLAVAPRRRWCIAANLMTSKAAGLAAAVTAAATGLYLLYRSEVARRQQEEVTAAFAEYSDSALHLVATDMDGTLLSPAAGEFSANIS